jgi:hypothetical protein
LGSRCHAQHRVDGDGLPDVVVTDVIRSQLPAMPHALWLLRQDPARRGLFLAPQLLASPGTGLYSAAIADVNGDSAPDAVVDDGLGTGDGAAVLLQNPGIRGTFRPPQAIALPGTPTYVNRTATGSMATAGRRSPWPGGGSTRGT